MESAATTSFIFLQYNRVADSGLSAPVKVRLQVTASTATRHSMSMQKVFVTRIIPDAGLNLIKQHCDAEVWPEPLPPPYSVIQQKVAECEGLVSLLTDKIDA